jgi:hypothetical protein
MAQIVDLRCLRDTHMIKIKLAVLKRVVFLILISLIIYVYIDQFLLLGF